VSPFFCLAGSDWGNSSGSSADRKPISESSPCEESAGFCLCTLNLAALLCFRATPCRRAHFEWLSAHPCPCISTQLHPKLSLWKRGDFRSHWLGVYVVAGPRGTFYLLRPICSFYFCRVVSVVRPAAGEFLHGPGPRQLFSGFQKMVAAPWRADASGRGFVWR